MQPDVTVIMATWNRGRHVLPSVRAILAQDHRNFELLVIGDGLDDDTEAHLAAIGDPRLSFRNLAERWGAQSGPNNAGIDAARAPIVAYCGHDDIWAPNHLSAVLEVFERHPDLGCVASGLVLHSADPARPYRVFGMFDCHDPFEWRIYTAPSGFAHRIDRPDMPRWRRRDRTGLPVDVQFQTDLAEAGFLFGSTGRLTVHKWAAGLRYLEYLVPCSALQSEMQAAFLGPDGGPDTAAILARAKATGGFMARKDGTEPKEDYTRIAQSDIVRGITLPDLVPLVQGVEISQADDPRGLDWYAMAEREEGWRWCGPNRRPRLLIPIAGAGPAEIEIEMLAMAENGFPGFALSADDKALNFTLEQTHRLGPFLLGRLRFVAELCTDAPLVLQFSLAPDAATSNRRAGFGVGRIRATPA